MKSSTCELTFMYMYVGSTVCNDDMYAKVYTCIHVLLIVMIPIESTKSKCVGLYCGGMRIGLIKPSVLPYLLSYKDVFVPEEVNKTIVSVRISDDLLSVEKRTESVNRVLKDLQSNGDFSCLKGWRNEVIFQEAMAVFMAKRTGIHSYVQYSLL